MNLNLREIEYILAIAEEGNITKASQRLFIAQPSLSQALKRVETEFGVTLFTRVKGRMKLTPEGELFVHTGRSVLEAVQQLSDNFSILSSAESGKLAVGVPYLLGSLIATCILPVYRERFPRIELSLVESSSSELEQLLMNGEIDICVIPLPFRLSEFPHHMLLQSRMVLLASKENEIRQECYWKQPGDRFPYVDIRKLDNAPFIIGHQGQRIRAVNEMIFKKAQITPHIVMISRSQETIKRMVANDIGYTFIPEHYLDIFGSSDYLDCYYLEPDVDHEWKVVVAYYDENHITTAMRCFLDVSDEYFRGIIKPRNRL